MTAPYDELAAERLRSKALSILRDGRLRVLNLRTEPNGQLRTVDAVVYGHSGEHAVGFGRGAWDCWCRDGKRGELCAHVVAAEYVAHGVTPPGRDGQPKHKRAAAPPPPPRRQMTAEEAFARIGAPLDDEPFA